MNYYQHQQFLSFLEESLSELRIVFNRFFKIIDPFYLTFSDIACAYLAAKVSTVNLLNFCAIMYLLLR